MPIAHTGCDTQKQKVVKAQLPRCVIPDMDLGSECDKPATFFFMLTCWHWQIGKWWILRSWCTPSRKQSGTQLETKWLFHKSSYSTTNKKSHTWPDWSKWFKANLQALIFSYGFKKGSGRSTVCFYWYKKISLKIFNLVVGNSVGTLSTTLPLCKLHIVRILVSSWTAVSS